MSESKKRKKQGDLATFVVVKNRKTDKPKLPTKCFTETQSGSIRVVDKCILDATEAYLCHQGNCVTSDSIGTTKRIFDAFPYSDCYKDRKTKAQRSKTSTIHINGGTGGKRAVVTMMSQYYPGESKYPSDSVEKRESYFRKCLEKLAELPMADNGFAFPIEIIDKPQQKYKDILEAFAKDNDVPVTLYKN